MIIDTKFNIGDEVYYVYLDKKIMSRYPVRLKKKVLFVANIESQEVLLLDDGTYLVNTSYLFPTKQSCQLECDRLNGAIYD